MAGDDKITITNTIASTSSSYASKDSSVVLNLRAALSCRRLIG